MKKNILQVAAMTTAVTLVPVSFASADENTDAGVQVPASEQCNDVEIITVAGTGESNENDDPNFIYGLKQGRNYTADLALSHDKVGAWQTPYSSTVGMVNSGGNNRGELHLPYGESREQGVAVTEQHIVDVKSACPGTKFVITGFSQGSSVAGDVAADLQAGKIQGAGPEDLFAAYLISDPNRSRVTDETVTTQNGAVAHKGVNGETIVDLDQGVKPGTEGLAGPRSEGAFAGTDNKVMSFCHPQDIACSTDADGLMQRIGMKMDSIKQHDQHYEYAGHDGLKNVDIAKMFGIRLLPIVGAAYNGKPEKVHRLVNEVADHRLNNMTQSQREAMRAVGEELMAVAEVIRDYNGTVPKYDGQILSNDVPEFVGPLAQVATFWDPQKKGRLVPWVTQMMPHHLSYFSKNELAQTPYGPWTVGGSAVDEFVYSDLDARLAAAGVN